MVMPYHADIPINLANSPAVSRFTRGSERKRYHSEKKNIDSDLLPAGNDGKREVGRGRMVMHCTTTPICPYFLQQPMTMRTTWLDGWTREIQAGP